MPLPAKTFEGVLELHPKGYGFLRLPQRNYAAQQATTTTQLNASNQRISDSQNDSRVAATVANDLKNSQAERCKKAREVYDKTIRSQRLYRENEKGERVFLSDAELAGARVDALKQFEAICDPNG